MEEVQQLYQQTEYVSLGRIKERNFQKFQSQGIKYLKNQTNKEKNQKWIVALMKQKSI